MIFKYGTAVYRSLFEDLRSVKLTSDVFNHSLNVCDHRNAQKRSSNSEYETPNPTDRDDQQSQYED